jgi:ABC-type branched-subunit amino acid transport system substrate-binding protein
LVAPFEGRYREVGYEVIYAARLAAREINQAGGIAGYSVELLALDDSGDPDLAAEQARKLAADPQVVGVVGHWLEATTQSAAPDYARAGLPLLATSAAPLPEGVWRLWATDTILQSALPNAYYCPPPCDSLEDLAWLRAQPASAQLQAPLAGPPLWGQTQFVSLAGADRAEGVYFVAPAPWPADAPNVEAAQQFAVKYRAISNGGEPRFYAVLAYDATQTLFVAIGQDLAAHATPSRAGVAEALNAITYLGLSGEISFDATGQWRNAQGWVYQWDGGQAVRK